MSSCGFCLIKINIGCCVTRKRCCVSCLLIFLNLNTVISPGLSLIFTDSLCVAIKPLQVSCAIPWFSLASIP